MGQVPSDDAFRASGRPLPQQDISPVLKRLKEVFRNPTAKFSCEVQARAVLQTLRKKSDLLVLMGTEKGKSMVYRLPVIMERGNLFTVVIFPLLPLIEDALAQSGALGIHAGKRDDRESEVIHLLYITPEHAVTVDFSGLGVNIGKKGRLARIVVEQCHRKRP